MLGILTKKVYYFSGYDQKNRSYRKEELAKKELELYDIKFEFGRVGNDNHIALN